MRGWRAWCGEGCSRGGLRQPSWLQQGKELCGRQASLTHDRCECAALDGAVHREYDGSAVVVSPYSVAALGTHVLEPEGLQDALDLAHGQVGQSRTHAALPGTWKWVTNGAGVMVGAGAWSR